MWSCRFGPHFKCLFAGEVFQCPLLVLSWLPLCDWLDFCIASRHWCFGWEFSIGWLIPWHLRFTPVDPGTMELWAWISCQPSLLAVEVVLLLGRTSTFCFCVGLGPISKSISWSDGPRRLAVGNSRFVHLFIVASKWPLKNLWMVNQRQRDKNRKTPYSKLFNFS